MSDDRFKIVFDGALLPGVESTTAKLNLAELFKTDVASIERLFTGREVALKRDLSYADAETYLQALKNAGVDARIKTEQPVAFSLAETHETATNNTPESPYAPPRAAVGEPLTQFATLKVCSLNGRIGRLRLLAWTLVLTVAMLVIGGVILLASLVISTAAPTLATTLGLLFGFVLVVTFFWINVQISVQRLHDLGWSGWLWFLHLVPIVNSIFPILLLVVPGNTVANQYGAPPPPNSRAVKVLAVLWLAFIPLMIIALLVPTMSGFLGALESKLGAR